MNPFYGLNIAMKGLYASQQGIYVTDHNISNAEATGYSRQIISQQASTPLKTGNGKGMMGTGVDVLTVMRMRDQFLDNRYWEQNVLYGEWNIKSSAQSELELIVNEVPENGLLKVLNGLYDALEGLSNDPSNEQSRSVVIENAQSFCQYLRNASSDLDSLREDYNSNIKVKVNQMNSLSRQISDLNEMIYKAELDGSIANDLRDQRTVVIDQLSTIADIKVNEVQAGTLPNGVKDIRMQITLDGICLVNHFDYRELECYGIEDGSAANGMYGIRWADTGMDVDIEGGELKGYLDLRDMDGTNGTYKGILYFKNRLDNFARTFAKAFNEGIFADGNKYTNGHVDGTTLDGETGIGFFSFNGLSTADFTAVDTDLDARYDHITAANISITSDIKDDLNKIAAASAGGEAENSENLRALIDIFYDTRVFKEGTPEYYIGSVTATMGVVAQYAERLNKSYDSVIAQKEKKRLSVSGVSLNEETTNLVKFQQAYSAAAQVISVLDEILDVTINGLGAG